MLVVRGLYIHLCQPRWWGKAVCTGMAAYLGNFVLHCVV